MDETERRNSEPTSGFTWPRAGSRIGESLRVVGSVGGSDLGVLYECEDEAIGRTVAVLVLDPARAEQPGRTERFLEASRAVARVSSPNVVTIYDVGTYYDVPYVVMEQVPAVTLDEHRRNHGGRLRPDAALDVADGILRGLTALHSAGIAHGGVQPRNILVTPNGQVVLTHAGFGRILADTEHPLPMPWLEYRPVWARGSSQSNAAREERADVHGAAAVLYELLTGHRPCVLAAENQGRLPAPSSLATVPSSLDAPLLDALTNEGSHLLDSARELRRTLEALHRLVRQNVEIKRILVVEDDPEVAGPLAEYLEIALAPVEILLAQDGTSAMEIANRTTLSLVILDLGLPGMNGLELTSALRSNSRLRDAPILVLTGRAASTDWKLLSALGANSLLMKPVSMEVVAAAADELCANRRNARKRLNG